MLRAEQGLHTERLLRGRIRRGEPAEPVQYEQSELQLGRGAVLQDPTGPTADPVPR